MKRMSVWLAVVLTVCVLLAADSPQQKRDADETVFGAALHQEEVEGNLEKAIAAYKDFLARNPSDRALAATAQFHIGLCYEKLGQAEAQKAYQQVLSTYADQTEIASQARTRLTALLKSMAEDAKEQASRPVFRRITIPGKIDHNSQLSSDGSRLAFASGGDLWVVNLHGNVAPDIAGELVRLTQGANAGTFGLTWSGNQQWIAFNENKVPSQNIYVMPASGGTVRTLNRAALIWGGQPWSLGLSQDGSRLAYSDTSEEAIGLRIVSVKTGDTVTRLGNSEAREPVFSPDDKRVAYIKREKEQGNKVSNVRRSEVRVVRLADGSDVRVAEAPGGYLRSPTWSPDGNLIAFLASWKELSITPLLETGEAASEPTKISLPRGAASIAGWTADNKIGLVLLTPFHSPIYTVPLSGGRATQVTAPDESGLGFFLPQWSPDGKRIYFRYGTGDTALVPAAGGEVSVIPRSGKRITETLPGGGNHISPDGKRIVFSGVQEGVPGVHLWIMPVTGGEPLRLPMKPDLNAWQPRWSPDGKWIAFEAERDAPDDKLDENIYVVSAEGGEPRQLTKHTSYCELAAWSPSGDELAYACNDNTIRIIPFKGGEPRVVLKADGLNSHGGSLAWTPDGTRLLYTAKGRIWIVAVSGGEPEAISTGIDSNHLQFSLSPDGKRIAFNAPSGQEPELWLMEDFLPLVKTAARK